VAFRILLVDDDVDTLDTLVRLLGRQGYTCRVASSGREAIRALDAESPDLVVTETFSSVSRSSCSSSMRCISRIDQALELGALHVIAGSGVEIQGYARGARTSRDRSGRKYSGRRRAVT